MITERITPLSVQAVDAFGSKAVKKVYPDWEYRNDFVEQDFAEIAEKSKVIFATDGTVLLPQNYLRVGKKRGFVRLKAGDAFRVFGLRTLAKVSEHGVAQIPPSASERFKRFLARRVHSSTKRVSTSSKSERKHSTIS